MAMMELIQEGALLGSRVFEAALLGMLIAYRRHADRQHMSIMHSHAYLAVAGALFIVIIGDQIERAIGLIGVATVIRYRYAIRNPKDAGTLIIALGIGMAAGAGLLGLAVAATVFVIVTIRLLDVLPSLLPGSWFVPQNETRLRLITTAPVSTLDRVEQVLDASGVQYSITTLERKAREEQKVTVVEAAVRFSGDLDIGKLTEELTDENIVTISWREIEAETW